MSKKVKRRPVNAPSEKRINLGETYLEREDVFEAIESNQAGKMAMITNSYDTLEQKQSDEEEKLKAADKAYREIKNYKN